MNSDHISRLKVESALACVTHPHLINIDVTIQTHREKP